MSPTTFGGILTASGTNTPGATDKNPVAANSDIRSDLHRIAESIAARSETTTVRGVPADVSGPEAVGTFRDALLARYHEGYIEGLHDMAEAVVGYLNSKGNSVDGRFPEPPEPVRLSGLERHAD